MKRFLEQMRYKGILSLAHSLYSSPYNNNMLRWFPNLYGFKESQVAEQGEIQPTKANYLSTQKQFKILNETQLQSLPNGRVFTMGVFSTPTLHDLRESAAVLLSSTQFTQPTENNSSNIGANSTGLTYEHLVITDILKMHSENPGATFQAASQFNCLEFGAPHVTPEYGVSSYAYDQTQGPACALACATGTIFRNYFAHVKINTRVNENNNDDIPGTEQKEELGQSENSQLNTLDELEVLLHNKQNKYWAIRNGYSFSDVDSLTRLNLNLQREWPEGSSRRDELLGAVKVGVQEGVGVTFSRRFRPFAPEVSLRTIYL